MALAKRIAAPKPLIGHAKPRIAPPVPARTLVKELQAEAEGLGMPLIPWQVTVGRYLYALGIQDRWLYPEVAAIVSRQNGKTKVLKPHVVRRLRMGRRILHLAQTRELPRRLFVELVPIVLREWPDAIIRRGAGQETIEIPSTGGLYLIAASTSGGARGISSIDDLLVDEVRQLDDDFVGAAIPTTFASQNPQTLYVSSAGDETTNVLNAIRQRGEDGDPALAYLEWSASPERTADDRVGWAEANPSLGHPAFPMLQDALERIYTSSRLSGNMAHFETEYLCRWVPTMRERLVDANAWADCHAADLEDATRPVMAISMDPNGKRASSAIAWRRKDETTGLYLIREGIGDPIDIAELGADMRQDAIRLGVSRVGFDPLTDGELAKFFIKTEAISGQKFAGASSTFVNLVNGRRLRWNDADSLTEDLTWTARKANAERGSFEAVRAKDDRPITAALAAIRAVGMASGPLPPSPRIY